jgi:hypothetical protein
MMRWVLLVAVVLSLTPKSARACGGGFPPQRLLQRDGTMTTMPDGTFIVEMLRVVTSGDKPVATPPACKGLEPAEFAFCLGDAARPLLGRDDETAIRWYAQQTAIESTLDNDEGRDSGAASLLLVGRHLVRDPARLSRQWHKPAVQRLASLTMWARDIDFVDENFERIPTIATTLESVLQRAPRSRLYAPAWLAAAAYRQGRYGLAEQILGLATSEQLHDDTGHRDGYVGHWLRSKLLRRRGNEAAANAELARAELGAEPGDQSSGENADGVTYVPLHRIRTERAVLELQQGRVNDAMNTLWPTANNQWHDVAYVAERVLAIAELEHFVASLPLEDRVAGDDSPGAKLRELLSRRLMREGRYDDALVHARRYIEPARRYAAARPSCGAV